MVIPGCLGASRDYLPLSMDKFRNYQALELMRMYGIDILEPIQFLESKFYEVILINDKVKHYFLLDENGELFYDGWDVACEAVCDSVEEIAKAKGLPTNL